MSIFNRKPKDKENKDIRVYEQWQLDEIVKCSLDPIYFILTYCKIIHKDRGLIPFTLYDYQIEYINMIHHNRFSIVMFPRQTGKTTTMCGYISWYVLFDINKKCHIIVAFFLALTHRTTSTTWRWPSLIRILLRFRTHRIMYRLIIILRCVWHWEWEIHQWFF